MKSTHFVLIMAVLLLSVALAHAQCTELLVYQVQAAQLPGTALVDVWYKLQTVGGEPVTVRLFLSTDAGTSYPFLCQAVTGDVGAGVLPGISRRIVWHAGTEFPGFSSTICRLRVTADDGVNLNNFTYVGPGTFTMGSPTNEPGRFSDENQHQVTLTHGIYVQMTEVTNQQYMELAQWAYDQGYVTATSSSLRDYLDGSTQELLVAVT
jgi:formylglycine-generating enzyme required for sulfatase activity